MKVAFILLYLSFNVNLSFTRRLSYRFLNETANSININNNTSESNNTNPISNNIDNSSSLNNTTNTANKAGASDKSSGNTVLIIILATSIPLGVIVLLISSYIIYLKCGFNVTCADACVHVLCCEC